MKTKLLLSSMLFLALVDLGFAQNRSNGAISTTITPALLPPGAEAFRFRSGLVTQLDFGTAFDFTASRWFGIGRLAAGTQTFYGLRLQLPQKSIVMGYNDLNAVNPRIEWIGTSAASTLGNLEFRVGSGFGTPGVPGPNLLVATMTSNGNTIFGDPLATGNNARVSLENSSQSSGLFARNVNPNGIGVSIQNEGLLGLQIETQTPLQNDSRGLRVSTTSGQNSNTGGSFDTVGATFNTGITLRTGNGKFDIGIQSFAFDAGVDAIGVQGITFGTSPFEAGIYGQTPNNNGNQFAGFFDGDVFCTTGNYLSSDEKLKENVQEEVNVLERLSALKAVTYDFKRSEGLNLPNGTQHGFIAQEIAKVFPELTKDIKKPVYDKDGKSISTFEFKSVNYTGLISVLTAAVNELNSELKALKQELSDLKEQSSENKSSSTNNNGVLLEQNTPNPFTDRTTIKYQLIKGTNVASIIVFDLNGRMIKEFTVSENKGEIEINSAQIGKGLFIYSLVQDGKELASRKMIIK